MTTPQIAYDEDVAQEKIVNWVQRALGVRETTCKKLVADHENAALAFEVKWGSGGSARGPAMPDMSSLSRSLYDKLGPLARLSSLDATNRTLRVYIMQLPSGAASQLRGRIGGVFAMINAHRKRPQWLHAVLFFASLAALVVSAVLLHNHCHEHEEPWKNTSEFVVYHLQYYFSSLVGAPRTASETQSE